MDIQVIPIKISVIGSLNVGKTSLVIKYATGKDSTNIERKTTKNAMYVSKKQKVNGTYFELTLWDTAGQEKYMCLTKLFTKDSKIAILVYAIDDEESFNMLDHWLKLIKYSNQDEDIIYAVVANKSDLASENTIPDKKRERIR